jgi:hypothetical protein
MAQEVVVSHHWTDVYWVDVQGVTNVVLAGGWDVKCEVQGLL